MGELINFEEVESKVLVIRDQQVLLDRDVAELYGVETKRINEAVKNNQEKFPNGYTIALDNNELYKEKMNIGKRKYIESKIEQSHLQL